MNDPIKPFNPQRQIPNPPGTPGRSLLKSDMPTWDAPTYLQENAFPLPKEIPPPPDKGKTLPEPGKSSAPKKQPQAAQAKKEPSGKKNAPGRKKSLYSDTAAEGYIRRSSILSWFNTFMLMNIPLIGWIYLIILSLRKKDQRKDFARAYLVYKLVFLLVALAIIAICLYAGMEAVDRLLQYINML